MPPDEEPAGGDLPFAEQTPHERTFSSPAGPEHADELARLDQEAHPIEERLLLPASAAIRHCHGQTVGHDRKACLFCERHGRGSLASVAVIIGIVVGGGDNVAIGIRDVLVAVIHLAPEKPRPHHR